LGLILRKEIIWITVIGLCMIGAYAMNSSYVDLVVMAISGVVGFFFRKLNFPLGPVILGLLLGRMAESNFRRAIALGGNSYVLFYTKPLAIILFALGVIALITPVIKKYQDNKKAKEVA